MAYAPCKNPNCKSYGKPHPNCRCFGEMAEGGEVESYCSQEKPHKPKCEHFSGGATLGTLKDMDAVHAVAGHLAHGGLVGILKMGDDIEKYEKSVHKGHKGIDSTVIQIFDGGLKPPEDKSKHHKHIDEWIDSGNVPSEIKQEVYNLHNPEALAGGGDVTTEDPGILHGHPIQHIYPEQNVALQAAKGRASQYLTSLKPHDNVGKLAFDASPDQSAQKKSYEKARHIANSPLSILHDISKGTVDAESIKHLKSMYPEVHDAMQKKVTEKIIDAQLKGKKPGAKVRQGLSMLMETPLTGGLTPQGIQAAQAVFAAKPQAQQPGNEAQKSGGKKSLSKSDQSFLTGSQALVGRSQRQS